MPSSECGDSAASRLVLSYGSLNRAIDEVEGKALRSLDACSPHYMIASPA